MTTTDTDGWLTLAEVARRLGTGVVTVRRRIKAGSLKAFLSGTANRSGYRVLDSELRRYQEAVRDAHAARD